MCLRIEFEMKEYLVEFNRTVAANMERNGFVLTELERKPTLMIPILIYGAFVMHHPKLTVEEIDRIYEKGVNCKSDFILALKGMYAETVNSLFASPEGADEKNCTWTKC